MDLSLFRFFNSFYNLAPPIWPWLTTGLATVAFAALAVLVAVWAKQTKWLVAALLAVVLTDVSTARGLKPAFARERPCVTLEEVRGGKDCGSGESMPSAHAANTMAVAAVIGSPTLAGVSLLVGVGRVIGGQHWPSDVAVGWGYGLLVGMVVRRAFQKVLRWG